LNSAVPILLAKDVKDDQKKIYVDDQIRLAEGLAKRGFIDEAIQEYARVIKRFPRDPIVAAAWVRLAETYAKKGDIHSAAITFEECFKRFPNIRIIPAAKYKYAMVLKNSPSRANHAKALKILRALAGNSKIPPAVQTAAKFQLAKILRSEGETAEAERILLALSKTPVADKPKDYYIVAAALEMADELKKKYKPAEAIKLLKPPADANFADKTIGPLLYWTLGSLQTEAGLYGDAAETFAKFAILFPGNPSIKSVEYNRLAALLKAGKHSKIIAEIAKLEKRGRLSETGWERYECVKGASLKALNFRKASIASWRRIVSETKENDYYNYAARNLVAELIASGDIAEAAAQTEKLIASGRLSPQTLAETAILAASASTPETAVRILESANSKIPHGSNHQAEIKLNLAQALARAGKHKKALANFAELLAGNSSPRSKSRALLGMADVFKALGDKSKAEQSLKRLLKEYPKASLRPNALFSLATLLLSDRKRWGEAEEILKELRKRHPKTPLGANALFYQAFIRFYEKKYNAAMKILNRLETSKPPATSGILLNARLYKIWTLLKTGKAKSAVQAYMKSADKNDLLKIAPQAFLCDLGSALPPSEIKTAEFCFKKALAKSKNPSARQKAFIGLSKAEMNSGDAVKAMEYLKKAVELDADPYLTDTARLELGRILVRRNANDAAVLLLEKCLENPVGPASSAAARLELAKALSKNPKRLATARRYAMAVYVLAKEKKLCADAMMLSIELSMKLNKRKEALEIWKEFAKRCPDASKTEKARNLRKSLNSK
jgi:tetratricopeptide (TPR) repeat protein